VRLPLALLLASLVGPGCVPSRTARGLAAGADAAMAADGEAPEPAPRDAAPDRPPWRFGPVQKDQCTGEGLRQLSAPLRNLPAGVTAEQACRNAPRNVMGVSFDRPDRCVPEGTGVRGQWDVPDSACASAPPPAPVRGAEGKLASAAPLEGYADLHLHQMAHLGFGGSVVWGAAFGPPAEALAPIPPAMKRGHDRSEALFDGDLAGGLVGLTTHDESGYPSFTTWPSRQVATHQQAYVDWLYRGYQGGLRLMVMLAVNSEDMFGRGENDLGPLGNVVVQPVRAAGRSSNDMETLEWQVREAYRLQDRVDADNGGPGRGWYRIVRDPDEAGAVIAGGKLAVILGTELQHLFNCDADRPACSEAAVAEGLDRLEAMGVNYVFPVHHKLNQFGGPSQFNPLTNGPTAECWETEERCSAAGLSPLGRTLVEELTARGMLVDTEHLSWRSFEDAMAIAEARRYPVLASHIGPFDLKADAFQTEHVRRTDQIQRILDVGGMLGVILGVGVEEYAPARTGPVPLPISCGGADRWANAYLYMRALAGGGLGAQGAGRITFGSDWNGFASWPGPRYGATPCAPRVARDGRPIPKPGPVAYPLPLPAGLVRAAIGGTPTLPRFEQFHPWDYNALGLTHAGLIPDFVEDLRMMGLTVADLEPLYRSARGVVELWRTARGREVPGDRHVLRWVPASPFDLLAFDPADHSRDLEVAPGQPLCRRRSDHRLGVERDGACRLVETGDAALVSGTLPPGSIAAYHAGRCLEAADLGPAHQAVCAAGDRQRWSLRGSAAEGWELVNAASGRCLEDDGPGVASRACTGQRWQAARTGNTFSLRTAAGLCLEVTGQSRADGAPVALAPCSGAAHQQWTIESLRAADHQRLYQAARGRVAWLAAADAAHPLAVTSDGTRVICRSRDPIPWAGLVTGDRCDGVSAGGVPVTTTEFERLFQGR
jgi:microsomal dipeptidase-like Zn-dependent dipeptidase